MNESEQRSQRMMNTPELDPEVQKQVYQMGIQAKCVQAELEGMYRQLYQACTQQMIVPQLELHKNMMSIVNQRFSELENLAASYDMMTRQDNNAVN